MTMGIDTDTERRWTLEDTRRQFNNLLDWLDTESILDEAKGIVENKARDYGAPADNAERIALLWDAYIDGKYGSTPAAPDGDWKITPDDVCMMMVLLKIARRVQTPTRDSLVDIAGWAAVADEASR